MKRPVWQHCSDNRWEGMKPFPYDPLTERILFRPSEICSDIASRPNCFSQSSGLSNKMIKICKIWDAGLFGISPQVRFFKRVQISLQYISCSTMKYWNDQRSQKSFSFSCQKTKKPENLRPPEHFFLRFLSPPSLTKSCSYLVVVRRKCRWPSSFVIPSVPLTMNGQAPYATHFFAASSFLWK